MLKRILAIALLVAALLGVMVVPASAGVTIVRYPEAVGYAQCYVTNKSSSTIYISFEGYHADSQEALVICTNVPIASGKTGYCSSQDVPYASHWDMLVLSISGGTGSWMMDVCHPELLWELMGCIVEWVSYGTF